MDDFLHTPLGWGCFMAAVFALASFAQGFTGVGFALLVLGLSTLISEPKAVVAMTAVAAIFSCISLSWFYRKDLRPREALPMALIAIFFIPIGAYFLKEANKSILIRTLGVVLIVLSLTSLFRSKGSRMFGHPVAKWFASICSGLTGGAFTMAGPPLAIYAYNCHWTLEVARANLQIIFLILSIVACATHAINGVLTTQRLLWGLSFVPVIFLFGWLGTRTAHRVSSERLAPWINYFLILMGLYHFIRG